MAKKYIVLFFVFLLSISYIFGADFIKVDDIIYVDKLESTPKTVKNVDNTDKLEFLVNKDDYTLDVITIKPDSVELKLLKTGETIVVNIKQSSSFTLEDKTKLFVKYLEFETKEIKLSLWVEGENVEETKTEEETSSEETKEESKEKIINTDTITEETKNIFTSKDYTNWVVFGSIIILVVVIGLIIYFNKKEGGLVS